MSTWWAKLLRIIPRSAESRDEEILQRIARLEINVRTLNGEIDARNGTAFTAKSGKQKGYRHGNTSATHH